MLLEIFVFREFPGSTPPKLEIDGAGTNESAEAENRTAKSVNILIYLSLLRSF